MDIVPKPSADRDKVILYNETADGMEGPDSTNVQFDMVGKINSLWNRRVVEILRMAFRNKENEEEWGLPPRSNVYVEDMFQHRFIVLRGIWRKSQFRKKANGQLETEEEWIVRVKTEELADRKLQRHLTRRMTVSEKPRRTTPSNEK